MRTLMNSCPSSVSVLSMLGCRLIERRRRKAADCFGIGQRGRESWRARSQVRTNTIRLSENWTER
jgi:hypothetical protein